MSFYFLCWWWCAMMMEMECWCRLLHDLYLNSIPFFLFYALLTNNGDDVFTCISSSWASIYESYLNLNLFCTLNGMDVCMEWHGYVAKMLNWWMNMMLQLWFTDGHVTKLWFYSNFISFYYLNSNFWLWWIMVRKEKHGIILNETMMR